MSRGIVTRTIREIEAVVIEADTLNEKLIRRTIRLPYKNLTSKNQVTNYIRKSYPKVVDVQAYRTVRTLYGCTEQTFCEFAEPYDVQTRKPFSLEKEK